jgi:hypothetical protein
MSWGNPYSEHNRRAAIADTNRERVLRQKKEREFLRGLGDKFEMSNMEEVEARLDEMNKIKLLDIRQAQRARGEAPVTLPERPPITTVGRLDASLRCFHPTHGGATLWTGEADGCIGIRNGTDGSLAYRIDKTENTFVDVITQSSAHHMWVGMSDGTIRIYDPIVFILLFEGKKHEKAITAFAETFDGKMFSASVDGAVYKWDSEAHEFECMLELPATNSAVRSLACYGYNLFIADDSPVVRCVDAESGLETKSFEGAEGTITCLTVIDGYLWTGSADSYVSVWTIDDAECVSSRREHDCGVTGLMTDEIGHTVWSSDESGQLNVWHSSADRGFSLLRSYVPDGAGAPVRLMKGYVAVDASKLWSLGGNGVNYVWHSATNRIERSTKQAVLAMEHIIDQDAKELERWAAVLANLQDVAARLRATMATQLGLSAQRTLAQESMLRWVLFAKKRMWRKRLPFAAKALEATRESELRARYLTVWSRFTEAAHRTRHHQNVAQVMERNRRNELLVAYVHKANDFCKLLRSRQVARTRAAALTKSHERRHASVVFATWLNLHATRKRLQKRQQMAAALHIASEHSMLHSFFSAWAGNVRRKKIAKGAVARSVGLGATFSREQMSTAYFTWQRFATRQRFSKRRARVAVVVSRRSTRTVLSAFYFRWARCALDHQQTARMRQLRQIHDETEALQSKLDAVEHITGRQRLVDEVQRLIDLTKANIDAKKGRLGEIEQECDDIVRATELKRSGVQEEVAKSIGEQVDDLIAMLKAKLLNLHQDYALARKVIEKAKNLSATKSFLEAHQAVKRIVVDMTGKTFLGSEDVWPLSEAKVRAMPKHHAESVLTAIKTMIITYDIMTPEERSSLQTDNEIAINAHWLRTFADACIAIRKKALGKAVFRVK